MVPLNHEVALTRAWPEPRGCEANCLGDSRSVALNDAQVLGVYGWASQGDSRHTLTGPPLHETGDKTLATSLH